MWWRDRKPRLYKPWRFQGKEGRAAALYTVTTDISSGGRGGGGLCARTCAVLSNFGWNFWIESQDGEGDRSCAIMSWCIISPWSHPPSYEKFTHSQPSWSAASQPRALPETDTKRRWKRLGTPGVRCARATTTAEQEGFDARKRGAHGQNHQTKLRSYALARGARQTHRLLDTAAIGRERGGGRLVIAAEQSSKRQHFTIPRPPRNSWPVTSEPSRELQGPRWRHRGESRGDTSRKIHCSQSGVWFGPIQHWARSDPSLDSLWSAILARLKPGRRAQTHTHRHTPSHTHTHTHRASAGARMLPGRRASAAIQSGILIYV